jgi:AcrR family transcriptional regulator
MRTRESPRLIGRPRSFSEAEALEKAMHVFWRKGYEGTSIAGLTEALQINRPSLYAAFGDKESLFRKVLARYEKGPASYVSKALSAATARAAVEQLILGSIDLTTNRQNPPGCLMVQGALACSDQTQAIRQDLNALRDAGEKALLARLKRAQTEGDLRKDARPADLARYVVAVIRGLAVQAASGATREELRKVVPIAMRAWPE